MVDGGFHGLIDALADFNGLGIRQLLGDFGELADGFDLRLGDRVDVFLFGFCAGKLETDLVPDCGDDVLLDLRQFFGLLLLPAPLLLLLRLLAGGLW